MSQRIDYLTDVYNLFYGYTYQFFCEIQDNIFEGKVNDDDMLHEYLCMTHVGNFLRLDNALTIADVKTIVQNHILNPVEKLYKLEEKKTQLIPCYIPSTNANDVINYISSLCEKNINVYYIPFKNHNKYYFVILGIGAFVEDDDLNKRFQNILEFYDRMKISILVM